MNEHDHEGTIVEGVEVPTVGATDAPGPTAEPASVEDAIEPEYAEVEAAQADQPAPEVEVAPGVEAAGEVEETETAAEPSTASEADAFAVESETVEASEPAVSPEPTPQATPEPQPQTAPESWRVSQPEAAEEARAALESQTAAEAGPVAEDQPGAELRRAASELVAEPTEPDAEDAAVPPTTEPEADAAAAPPTTEPEPEAAPPTTEPEPKAAPPTPVSAGRFVAAALRAAGVKFAFTVPGESFLGLLESLEGAGIRVVATRHEGAAAFMAEAYGQLTGRPAACLATRAVGAANLSIGIHTARQDSTPMFAIVGQVQRSRRGREAFQEVDLVESIGKLAKWAVEVDKANSLPGAVEEAIRRALSGRPGPVLLSLPEDLLDEMLPAAVAPVARRMTPPPPDPDDIRAVIHILTDAERPVIIAGSGVLRARATSDLVRLAEILEVPVVAGWRRPDVFPNQHRLYLGHTGFGAPGVLRERLTSADAILVIGSRLSEPTTFDYRVPAPGARWAHVDLEPRRAHAGLEAPTIALTSDARTFLRAARERLAGAVHDAAALDARRERNEADRAAWEEASTVDAEPWTGPGVHPGRVVTTLRSLLPTEAIVTTDAGNFGGWAARGFRFLRPGTFVGPTSGAMGYGLPAAIAAALVHRDRPVVALCGDGGFAMTMAELETAVRERLRPIVLVFDNRRYGTIRAHQAGREAGVGVATELGPVDFAAIAEALGARGVRVGTDDAFEPALRDALAADRPTVLHLALDRAWVSVAAGADIAAGD